MPRIPFFNDRLLLIAYFKGYALTMYTDCIVSYPVYLFTMYSTPNAFSKINTLSREHAIGV